MSGNGVDIGAVYQLLTQIAETLAGHDLKLDSIDRRLDGVEGRLDGVDHRLDDLTAGLAGLRQAVTEYHASSSATASSSANWTSGSGGSSCT